MLGSTAIEMTRGVYLIHLEEKMHHAQHYIGSASDIEARFREHGTSQGAKMLRAARERGIAFHISRIWRNQGRKFERLLKSRKKARLLCPDCNPRALSVKPRPRKRHIDTTIEVPF